MSVIVLDGPEKAGKTTFARLLQKLDPRVRYRHWGPVKDHREYLDPLAEDVARPYPVVWDRAWPSEFVYGTMLDRRGELVTDPFLGEWYYGRLALMNGVRIVVAPMPDVLKQRRLEEPDPTDLPVDPFWERLHYVNYADHWGWQVFTRTETEQARAVLDVAWRKIARVPIEVQGSLCYVGPWDAGVVFVGDERNPNDLVGLPFSSRLTTNYGRALGPSAMKCGWTNASEADPLWLRGKTVVACGQRALTWCYRNGLEVHGFPHPSYLYRWGKAAGQVVRVETEIRAIVAKEVA